MNKEDKNKEPEKFDMGIQAAAEKWPDSKSRAFYLGDHPDSYYFIKTSKATRGTSKIRSRVECLKLHIRTGTLVSTHLNIRVKTIINPITFKQYVDKVHEAMRKLLEQDSSADLSSFETWGFTLETQNPDNNERKDQKV